jgi:ectoine hydroxylase-related dioxygenase (phytanoyl-CoA dioxygenase family)
MSGPSAQEIFELETYGFTVLEQVIDPALAAELVVTTAEMDRLFGTDYVHEQAYARHIMNLPALHDAYLQLVDHERLLGVLRHFLGDDLILGSLNARNVRPGDPEQPLHSDIPEPLRRGDLRPVMFNAAWMLDGFDPARGATRIVPGSHLSPHLAPPDGVEVRHLVVPEGSPGSVLVFNGQCWHGGGANRSNEVRHALFAHYRAGPWMRFQCDPHVGFPQERWERLNATQRRLLRMEEGLNQPNAADYYR